MAAPIGRSVEAPKPSIERTSQRPLAPFAAPLMSNVSSWYAASCPDQHGSLTMLACSRQIARTTAFVFALLAADHAHAIERWFFRMDGYGQLRYGMTKARVQRLVGRLESSGAEGCDFYEAPRRSEINGLGFMHGRLVSVSASAPRLAHTSDGPSIGDSADVLTRVYGARMVKGKDYYQPQNDPSYWTATISGRKYFLRYFVADGKIESIDGGPIAADGLVCPD